MHLNNIVSLGADYIDKSAMYGVNEYLAYVGYGTDKLFNQYIQGHNGNVEGYTYDQYKAEIDAGNPVVIQVTNRSMVGYGYVPGTNTINVYDTWPPNGLNPGTMQWVEYICIVQVLCNTME